MNKKNIPERIGELIPYSKERTPQENRLVGTFMAAIALIGFWQIKYPISEAAHKTRTICVTTDGSTTRWGNSVIAQDKLIEQGVHLPDTREILDKMPTTMPVEVCGKKRVGLLSNIVGMVPFVGADIEIHEPSTNALGGTQLAPEEIA